MRTAASGARLKLDPLRRRKAATSPYADLLLVDGNPLEDLGAVTDSDNIRIIMKDGVIYKNTLD